MAFEANIQLATLDGIHTSDFRVFHMIMPTIQDGNQVYINLTGIARALKTTVPVVSRSVRKLIQKGILERVEGQVRVYQLNPSFGWYGSDNGVHTQAIKHWSSRSVQ